MEAEGGAPTRQHAGDTSGNWLGWVGLEASTALNPGTFNGKARALRVHGLCRAFIEQGLHSVTRKSKNFLITFTIVVFHVVFIMVGGGMWFLQQGDPFQSDSHEQAAPRDDAEDSPAEEPTAAESDPAAGYGGPPEVLFEMPHACEALAEEREASSEEEQDEALLAAWNDGSAQDGVPPGSAPKLEQIRLSAQSPGMERMLMALLPAVEPDEAPAEETALLGGGLSALEERAEEMATRARIPPGRVAAQKGGSESSAELRQDIERLQEQVEQLQDSLETHMGGLVSRLESENARLRQEIQQLHAQRQASEEAAPSGVPQPRQQDWLDEMISEQTGEGYAPDEHSPAAPDWLAEAAPRLMDDPAFQEALDAYSGGDGAPAAPQEESAEPGMPAGLDPQGDGEVHTHGSLAYTVTREWGRDPEAISESEQEAASLQGMIGAVERDASDEQLLDLAADLRERYDEYDNINIEFFRGARAAQEFAENSVALPESRVLSVSKHANTGRDVILLIREDEVEEYEWPDDFGEEEDTANG